MKTLKNTLLLVVVWSMAVPSGLATRYVGSKARSSMAPVSLADGPNLYAYVEQNPWTQFDPEGLQISDAPGSLPPAGPGYHWEAQGNRDGVPLNPRRVKDSVQPLSPRTSGVIGAVGSGLEMIGGAATAESGVGIAGIVHGGDNFWADLRQIATGQPTKSVTEKTITAVTGSPGEGAIVNNLVGVGLTGASGIVGATSNTDAIVDQVSQMNRDAQVTTAELKPSAPATNSPSIHPSEVVGKTPAEIDALAKQKGLISKGPDPAQGKGSYIDPVTGKQRILSHPGEDPPTAHVNDPQGNRLNPQGNQVPKDSPDAHLPMSTGQ